VELVVETLFIDFSYITFQQSFLAYGRIGPYLSRGEALLIKRLVEREI
jgi:hypothetical protein